MNFKRYSYILPLVSAMIHTARFSSTDFDKWPGIAMWVTVNLVLAIGLLPKESNDDEETKGNNT